MSRALTLYKANMGSIFDITYGPSSPSHQDRSLNTTSVISSFPQKRGIKSIFEDLRHFIKISILMDEKVNKYLYVNCHKNLS